MDNETKGKALDSILEEGVDFSVSVTNPGFLHRIGLLKTKRTFVIKPIRLGTLVRISKILLSIDGEIETKESVLSASVKRMAAHAEQFAEIAALAVTNDEKPPSRRQIRFLLHNLSVRELLTLIQLVIRQMDVSNFLLCIVSVKGMSLMSEATGTKAVGETSGEQSAA